MPNEMTKGAHEQVPSLHQPLQPRGSNWFDWVTESGPKRKGTMNIRPDLTLLAPVLLMLLGGCGPEAGTTTQAPEMPVFAGE